MKKLFVLSAIAALAACGGSDPKPADPSTTSSTPAASATPAGSSSPAPASTDAAKPADPAKK